LIHERRPTVAYLATELLASVQFPGRETVAMSTASIDARTTRMEHELRGRATVTLFDIYAAVHPR
jgi:hypothetical protein